MGKPDTVTIRELPGLQSFDVRVAPESETYAAIKKALGVELPMKPGKMGTRSVSDEVDGYMLCLAPDWWLIVGMQEVEQRVEPLRMEDNYHFSVVDVSGQRTTIELEGPDVLKVLSRLWDQDLRLKCFPVGSMSQGLMAKAPVIVCNIGEYRYRIMVRSSFARHLWNVLEDLLQGD